MIRLAIALLAWLAVTAAPAADLLIRASSQATATLGLFTLGLKPSASALFPWPTGMTGTGNYPYLQGQTSKGNGWIVVIAGGGTGALLNAGATYDAGFWITLRWNDDIALLTLPAQLVAYQINGVPQGALTQPSAAVLATAPGVM